jgi:hypothetical protein
VPTLSLHPFLPLFPSPSHLPSCLPPPSSNQAQPPLYVILSSNISGEWRFASAVARRLEQLGALTQGDRRAASSADALAQYNLQNKWVLGAGGGGGGGEMPLIAEEEPECDGDIAGGECASEPHL